MKKLIILSFVAFVTVFSLHAVEYQWSTPVKSIVSTETNKNPRAFLWIPSKCQHVRAVVIGQHNMSEETLFDNPYFRQSMADLGFAIVWISPIIDFPWNPAKGGNEAIKQTLDDLAEVSGYSELKYAPIVPVGHSAMATQPWNFAAWNADRTLAIISLHGDAPRTFLTGYGGDNVEWGKRNIDGIPGLMIEGEYEWWEDRVNPALAFRITYPKSCISFLCDTGRGHFDVSDKTASYIGLFLKKAADLRLPANPPEGKLVELKKVDPAQGWFAERWHPNQKKRAQAAPVKAYKGDPHDAFWYFDKEIALATEARYAETRGKKEPFIGFVQQGKLSKYDPNQHAKIIVPFIPEADGITFHLNAAFTDSSRTKYTTDHPAGKPKISRICGPVKMVNDTTFQIDFYYMGMDNVRRSNDLWLLAGHPGDKAYKSSVQQLNLHFPMRNTTGERQYLLFAGINDVKAGTASIALTATSDKGLPVHFYVKEGPASIDGNQLRFSVIPPKAKFPIKVTVVAWQYGIQGKFQSADPVERSFYIVK